MSTGVKTDNGAPRRAPTITLCMFVKDEGESLGDVIERVFPIVDEIVIGVDNASSDDSLAIAQDAVKRKGKGVCYRFTWRDDFAAQRNATIQRATSDFALILDGHEYIENPPLVRHIAEMFLYSDEVSDTGEKINAAPFASFLTIMADHQGRDELFHPRLLRMSAEPEYHGRIHHRLNVRDDGGIAFKEVRLIHQRPDANKRARQKQRYDMIPAWAEDMRASSDKQQWRRGTYYLGSHYLTDSEELGITPNYMEGVKYLDEFVKDVGYGDLEGAFAAHMAWQGQYQWEQAEPGRPRAPKHVEDHADGQHEYHITPAHQRAWDLIRNRNDMPHGFMAWFEMCKNQWLTMRAAQDGARTPESDHLLQQCEWACRAALDLHYEAGPLANARCMYTYAPACNLTWTYQMLGNYQNAIDAGRKAMRYDDLPDAHRAEICAQITMMEQALQDSLSPVVEVHGTAPSIAVFDRVGSFSPMLVDQLKAEGWRVQTFNAFDPRVMNQVDVAYFDWIDDTVVAATARQPWRARIYLQSQGYDAMATAQSQMNWSHVDCLGVPGIQQQWHLEEFSALRMRGVRVEICPAGVDTSKWTLMDNLNPQRVCVVGYMNLKKGPQAILPAIAHMQHCGSDLEFHFAGDYQCARTELYYRNAIAGWGLKNVHMHGWQEDINAWLEDVRPTHSLTGSMLEGCPYHVLEAASKGIQPLIHWYPGAERQWPEAWLWTTPNELRGLLELDVNHAAREYVQEHYELRDTLGKRIKIFHELRALGPRVSRVDDASVVRGLQGVA